MYFRQLSFALLVAPLFACTAAPVEPKGSTRSPLEEGDELLTNARLIRTPSQLRLENTAREACKGRQTIMAISLRNNGQAAMQFTSVAHGYRNAEQIPVQITRVSRYYLGAGETFAIPFDGDAVKRGSIEVVSVTLDALQGATFADVGVVARFVCGEPDGPQPGSVDDTGTVTNTRSVSCLDLAVSKNAEAPMCEFNGNQACSGQGSETNDCEHCCHAVGPGLTEPL